MTRHIWYKDGQEPLAGGAIMAEAGTTSSDNKMTGSN